MSKLTRFVSSVAFASVLFIGAALPAPAQASVLTQSQVQSIIGLLTAFGADPSVIANVQIALGGTSPATNNTNAYDYNSDGKIDNADLVALFNVAQLGGACPANKTCDITAGSYSVSVCADTYDTVPETNEGWNSNCKTMMLTVNPASTSLINTTQTASVVNAFDGSASLHYVWNTDLQIGSPYTTDVIALQRALTSEGVYSGDTTGGFYIQTYLGVKAFQQKYGIKASGYVGSETRAKLNALYQ